MTDPNSRTPLYRVHEEIGARFTDFGGWEMPVSYAGIREEHAAVREAAGVFDVSHMGQVAVEGPDAEALMERLTSNAVAPLSDGDAEYAMILEGDGVILDDTVLYRRAPTSFLFVPNAGHDAEMADRWREHRDRWGLEASVENVTDEHAMLAVQGPDAPAVVAEAMEADLGDVGFFEFVETAVGGVDCLVSRTGYTGEPGVELLARREDAEALWATVADDCAPCGLGARDTLRLEMGFLLSGQDFHPVEEPRNPYEADVAFTVDLSADFVGREALAAVREAGGPSERLAGFVLEERGVPRHGYPLLTPDGERVGAVTSGTMSPTLDEPIGLGYVPTDMAEPGTGLAVEVRGEQKPATVQATPFIPRP